MKKFVLVPYDELHKIPSIQSNSNKLSTDSILESIPKNSQHKAKAILNHINTSSSLNWNALGEISIDGQIIEKSHITDLIKCSLYPYKDLNPVGYNNFRLALQKSNIPQTLIQQGKGLNFSQKTSTSNIKSPPSIPPPGIPLKNSKISKTSTPSKTSKTSEWKWYKM